MVRFESGVFINTRFRIDYAIKQIRRFLLDLLLHYRGTLSRFLPLKGIKNRLLVKENTPKKSN